MKLSTSRPDPKIYNLAAIKVKNGSNERNAILSSAEELYPQGADFDLDLFNWKWEHLHQYRTAFNLAPLNENTGSAIVQRANRELAASSLDIMAKLCIPSEKKVKVIAKPKKKTHPVPAKFAKFY